MIEWFTRRRRMVGGLYFGPPGWAVDRIEDTLEVQPLDDAEPKVVPEGRSEFAALLESIGLQRTSGISPGLLEQMREIGRRDIRALVVNLLPTQPEFVLGPALSRIGLAEMFEGLGALQRVVKARRIMIVGDRHDWRTRRLWRRARRAAAKIHAAKRRRGEPASPQRFTFDVQGILNQYPVAEPSLLLRRLFGKRLPVGRLPVRVNRLIVDPVTLWALGRWMRTGERFVSRPVQIFGRSEKEGTARLVMAKIGETIDSLCRRCGVEMTGKQVIRNGMLSGEQVDPSHAIVESSTESISVREMPMPEHSTSCFACGWCVDVCPTGLNPVNLMTLAEEAQRGGGAETLVGAAELRSSEARESLHCIGCGLCSYVCPTRLPLTQRTLRLRGWVVGSESDRGARHDRD